MTAKRQGAALTTQGKHIIIKTKKPRKIYNLEIEKEPVTGSGYKDWFVENYQKPGLTIEVSPYVGERKVPIENYKDIFERNKNVPILFAQEVLKLDDIFSSFLRLRIL